MNIEYLAEISKLEICKNEYSDYESKLCAMLKMVEDTKFFEQSDLYNEGKFVKDLRTDAVYGTESGHNTCFSVPKVVE